MIKYYLDKGTIPRRPNPTDEQWADRGRCFDVKIDKVTCATNARAHEEQKEMKDEEAWLMVSRDQFRAANELFHSK